MPGIGLTWCGPLAGQAGRVEQPGLFGVGAAWARRRADPRQPRFAAPVPAASLSEHVAEPNAEVMMRSMTAATVLIFGLSAAVAAQQPAADAGTTLPSIELPAELDRVLRDYERAWAAGDAQALARLFTEDGFVPGPLGWRRGTSAIAAQYARAGGDLRLRAHGFFTDGDAGWIIGAYGYGDGAAQRDVGKFVLALRRSPEGRWLIAADLDGPNRDGPG